MDLMIPQHDTNPIADIIAKQGFMVLDGGLASTLEDRGFNLNDDLWSARLLFDDPKSIWSVHREFLDAGADCIISASYQASLAGFAKLGLDDDACAALLRSSVGLACDTRQAFVGDNDDANSRPHPLVAASVGPYGAALADGSEYTGNYGLTEKDLLEFHRNRWLILSKTSTDIMACETIPSLQEASALLTLLDDTPGRWAWLSFSCRDGRHLCDGNLFADAVRMCAESPQVAAVGINCTAPHYVASLIKEARRVTKLPILAYPNSGEEYDATTKTWKQGRRGVSWSESVSEWWTAGARGLGGCCRVGPEAIAKTRKNLDRLKCTKLA
jgi:homocysteine S-methyltransferase